MKYRPLYEIENHTNKNLELCPSCFDKWKKPINTLNTFCLICHSFSQASFLVNRKKKKDKCPYCGNENLQRRAKTNLYNKYFLRKLKGVREYYEKVGELQMTLLIEKRGYKSSSIWFLIDELGIVRATNSPDLLKCPLRHLSSKKLIKYTTNLMIDEKNNK